MERCFETVDGAKPNSSVIWQTHNSPRRNASRIRTRFGSDNALVMAMNSRIANIVISSNNEIIIARFPAPVKGFLGKTRLRSGAGGGRALAFRAGVADVLRLVE